MISAFVFFVSLPLAASGEALRIEAVPTGEWTIRLGNRAILTAGLVCHGANWSAVHQAQATNVVRPRPGRFRGTIAMPKGNKGRLTFDVAAEQEDSAVRLDFEVTFEEENEIRRQGIALVLPGHVFAGRRLIFFPAESEIVLSAGAFGLGADRFGSSFAVELDAERALLVRTNSSPLLSLSGAGEAHGGNFIVGVRMVEEGKIAAGATSRRRLMISVVPMPEARRLASRWKPGFDRTRPSLLLDANGRLWMRDRQRDCASAAIIVQDTAWKSSSQDDMVGWTEGDDNRRTIAGTFQISGPGGTGLRFDQSVRTAPDGIDLSYVIDFPRTTRLNSYAITWSLRTDEFAGRHIDLIGPEKATPTGSDASTTTTSGRASTSRNTLTIPLEPPAKAEVGTFTVTQVRVAPDEAFGFTLELDEPTDLRIEDRRAEDSQVYELRLQFARSDKGTTIPAGTKVRRAIHVRPNRPCQIVLDDTTYAHRTDTADWAPYTLPWDTSAVDLSFLNDAPAGRHGFLQATGSRFVFADGTPGRFWGTCFTSEQNLPPHRDSEIIAERLARHGVNLVRIHQADAGYGGNNLFREKWQRRGTRELHAGMMDRLDYLVSRLKQRGIYVYFDLLSTRTFDESDGVASAPLLDLGGKPYAGVDEHLIRLQEEFAHNFLTHKNPYTQLAYKDDPAVAMIALVNENDVFSRDFEVEPYRTRFELLYRAWALNRRVSLPAGKIDLRHMTPDLMRFKVEVQRAYNKRMMRFLRELGVRAPITGSNWTADAGLVASLSAVDFTDSHGYWDHCWDDYTRIRNRSMVRSRWTIFNGLAFQRVPEKPFFCSEWGQPWPNEFRAEMPLAVASVAALQGWGGALIYTYAHRSNPDVDCLSGPFETLNDPCLWGLFYHAALIVRRADVDPARERLAVQLADKQVYAEKPATPYRCPAYDVAAERSVVATAIGTKLPTGWRGIACSQPVVPRAEHAVSSDTGQYARDWRNGIATVNTPRTQAAWGFLGQVGKPVRLGDVELKIDTPFATVAVSSLTGEPISRSRRILLTAVARAENTGMVYDLFHTRKLEPGHGPIVIEPVRGCVMIRTSQMRLRVRPLDPRGQALGEVPTSGEGGYVRFEIGPQGRTIHYLIEAM